MLSSETAFRRFLVALVAGWSLIVGGAVIITYAVDVAAEEDGSVVLLLLLALLPVAVAVLAIGAVLWQREDDSGAAEE